MERGGREEGKESAVGGEGKESAQRKCRET